MRFLLILLLLMSYAAARDNGQYAQNDPQLRQWFDGLKSGAGNNCCSNADGLRLKTDAIDPEWECGADKCRVKILGKWYDVPEEALILGANRVGYAVVWYYFNTDSGDESEGALVIRCFLRGTET